MQYGVEIAQVQWFCNFIGMQGLPDPIGTGLCRLLGVVCYTERQGKD